jgi:hypothetical protein
MDVLVFRKYILKRSHACNAVSNCLEEEFPRRRAKGVGEEIQK